jgi:CheY-like chemotaxis protein
MGRGTGLGMASAYGIIKNHKGVINVYSEKGKGTTFTIYLPASSKQSIPDGEEANALLTGGETILLVDDEPMILDVGMQMIQKLGYTVHVAESGTKALELYLKHNDRIQLIILDMIMPEMSGDETFNRLRSINAAVKVLLSSGYSINGEASKILERGCNGFIQKPFNLIELSRKIREILDSPVEPERRF